jgi:hypothetical protein
MMFLQKTQGTTEVAASNHNLRPRPERSSHIAIEHEEIADCETIGDFLSDNEGDVRSMHCNLPYLYLVANS